MKPKKIMTIAFLAVALFFVSYSLIAAPLISDKNYTYISGLSWYKTVNEGLSVAKEQNKPILVYFWTEWCEWCKKLHTEVYPSEEVNKMLRSDFVLVAVDLDTNKEDTQRFGVQYPPYLIFLSPEGKILTRIPGYLPKEELLQILKQTKARQEVNVSQGEFPQTRGKA